MRFALSIPTYRRTHLLEKLLGDVSRQTLRPETVVVVDGDPSSGEVLAALRRLIGLGGWQMVYVPSNHGNLPYQRYLGYLSAEGHDLLLYLDDDLRVDQSDAIERALAPLLDLGGPYVAGTGMIRFPPPPSHVTEGQRPLLARWFGSARHTGPGGLTPAGHRVLPPGTDAYARVEWLRGGVMAFRMSALDRDVFSDDLFALAEVGCGMGEDTFLGLRVRRRGELYFANCAVFDHPNADTPKAYPTQRFRKGRADSYSRRFLNDHYRAIGRATLGDRWALLKSWSGAALSSWTRGLRHADGPKLAYAAGYTAGVARGILVQPRAAILTPAVSWRRDAERALDGSCVVTGCE